MTAQPAPAEAAAVPNEYGLSTLHAVPLPAERAKLLSNLEATSQGSPVWRARKRAEARDLLALEAIAPRVTVLAIELSTELLAIVRIKVPVPCMPAHGELVVVGQVDLALRYPEEILHGPLPGAALVQIPMPRRVWHPNIGREGPQSLCLGANVPQGLPLREAVLGSYAALTLQSITLDPADSAGLMNPDALEFWNAHTALIPLTTAAFLDEPESSTSIDAQESSQGTNVQGEEPTS